MRDKNKIEINVDEAKMKEMLKKTFRCTIPVQPHNQTIDGPTRVLEKKKRLQRMVQGRIQVANHASCVKLLDANT